MSIERNGDWRCTTKPSLARTWRSILFEWTICGICIGFRLPRWPRGKPPLTHNAKFDLSLLFPKDRR